MLWLLNRKIPNSTILTWKDEILSVMFASLSAQAFGALGRGCWHYFDQTERSQSVPSVSTSAAGADLCLCLLRMPGERHNMYVQEDNGCGCVCSTLSSGCCTQTTQCSSLAWSYAARMIHSVWCMKYQSTMLHFHDIIVFINSVSTRRHWYQLVRSPVRISGC